MKTHLKKVYASILAAGLTASAMAQSTDPMDNATAKLSAGATAAGVLAATIAALFAGIWVYKLIRKGGSKVAS